MRSITPREPSLAPIIRRRRRTGIYQAVTNPSFFENLTVYDLTVKNFTQYCVRPVSRVRDYRDPSLQISSIVDALACPRGGLTVRLVVLVVIEVQWGRHSDQLLQDEGGLGLRTNQ